MAPHYEIEYGGTRIPVDYTPLAAVTAIECAMAITSMQGYTTEVVRVLSRRNAKGEGDHVARVKLLTRGEGQKNLVLPPVNLELLDAADDFERRAFRLILTEAEQAHRLDPLG